MSSIILKQEQDGQQLQVKTGDTLVLELPEIPTSGVRWSFDLMEDPIILLSDEYEQTKSNGIGGTSLRKFTLQAKSPGQAKLRLRRWQEWEGDSTIDARFACEIDIK